jgi:hypothetical protein
MSETLENPPVETAAPVNATEPEPEVNPRKPLAPTLHKIHGFPMSEHPLAKEGSNPLAGGFR